jgi:hypothetical protein
MWGIGCDAPGSPLTHETDPSRESAWRSQNGGLRGNGLHARTLPPVQAPQDRHDARHRPSPATGILDALVVERDPQELPTLSSLMMGALSVLLIGSAGWVMTTRKTRR